MSRAGAGSLQALKKINRSLQSYSRPFLRISILSRLIF
jgi:hypothetical protein